MLCDLVCAASSADNATRAKWLSGSDHEEAHHVSQIVESLGLNAAVSTYAWFVNVWLFRGLQM